MNDLSNALAEARDAEQDLFRAFLAVAERNGDGDGQDFRRGCTVMSNWSKTHLRKIENLTEDFGLPYQAATAEPTTWQQTMPEDHFGLSDFDYLLLLVHHVRGAWSAVCQAARETHAPEMVLLATQFASDTDRQIAWLNSCLRPRSVGIV